MPLLGSSRYKGAKGGRGSGKSHFFAELLVEECIADPDLPAICIREVQKSLRFSAKRLVEGKIEALGVGHLFDVQREAIFRKGGQGLIIFQGMQDHTADSIKSLEGFRRAWVEEAHSLSARSMELLLPTIREEGSEIWFSWNPELPTDPVDRLMCGDQKDDDSVCVHVNYTENPFLPSTMLREAEKHRRRDPETFGHVWLGEYVERTDAQILGGKYTIAEFVPEADWQGPYFGLDFGFAMDPTAMVRCWVHDNRLFIDHEAGKTRLELDQTASYFIARIPDCMKHVIRADSARPESISYLKRKGLPKVEAVKKWPNSVEDGIAHLRSYDEIVIHPRCKATAEEARRYSYKVDKATGDVLPTVVDAFNHYIDATRYALGPLIKRANSWGAL